MSPAKRAAKAGSAAFRMRLSGAIAGQGAHVQPAGVLEALSAAQARRRAHPSLATIWEQLAHLVYWQELLLGMAAGRHLTPPVSAAEGWPPMPPRRQDAVQWPRLVRRFRRGLACAARLAAEHDPGSWIRPDSPATWGSLWLVLANHNSYHLGQMVTLRRMIGCWPPPSGGDTW